MYIDMVHSRQTRTNNENSKECVSGGTKPVLDLSNNMRHVLVPADTKPGTTIYRLRASDADDNYPLIFRVEGKKKIHKIVLKRKSTKLLK